MTNGDQTSFLHVTTDVGGTFTDVVVADGAGQMTIGKSPTRVNAGEGVLAALGNAADQLGQTVEDLLGRTQLFTYSTTRSTNAILERTTAKTALLTTEGFPDILVLREGGREDAFDSATPYPEPFIPRELTREIPERINSEGEVVRAMDEDALVATLRQLAKLEVEAVAVCFLWSVMNDVHELRAGELIEEVMPGVAWTLSHRLNPVAREYRRASATAIDASLKPLMGQHFKEVEDRLRGAGLSGEFMVATSRGGVLHAAEVSERPIDTVKSGPSMAPVAGITFAGAEGIDRDLIVCDTGGTSFDVSLIRDARVSFTRETWLGRPFTGHLTGTTSVDIRSIGAGGGSIAWIDPGGLLRVGPQSAGAEPGPACYQRGGTKPTITDAAVALGWIDPDTFLGGRMQLDAEAARTAIRTLSDDLGRPVESTAEAILSVGNEHMVRAIHDITVKEGVDPRESIVVAGGGAAGLNVVSIVRELGGSDALVPRAGGALSAVGAQFSDVVREFAVSSFLDTGHFDIDTANAALERLDAAAAEFGAGLRSRGIESYEIERFVDARYKHQVWDLEMQLPFERFKGEEEIEALRETFDATHLRVFAVTEPDARIECLTWKARVSASVGNSDGVGGSASTNGAKGMPTPRMRKTYMNAAFRDTAVYDGSQLPPGAKIEGPAIIEEPTSTLVVPLGAKATLTNGNSYYLEV
ncbi:MAG: hydantoinase/oxoprolinase family protein [Actinobacteria bacterium]|nr:hydantoinase/oxoprolinase family protein [Actinomycetota bacterium]